MIISEHQRLMHRIAPDSTMAAAVNLRLAVLKFKRELNLINPANTCFLIGHSWTEKDGYKICLRCGCGIKIRLQL